MKLSLATRAATLVAGIALLAPLWGCGGGGSGASSTRMATATFAIRWPGPSSRVIPDGTNRFVIYVNGDGMSTQSFIVDQPTSPSTTVYTYRVQVPAGTRRLFSAAARHVAATKYSGVTSVASSNPDLLEGTLLGAGIDPQPYDIAPNTNTTANVEILAPGQPEGETSDVTGTINQIITTTWPSIAILEIFRDQDGKPITNINAGNLEVIEDGLPGVITDVRTVVQAGQPLSVALVLDRSGSMGSTGNANLENAASTFVSLMGADDAGEVVNFSSSVHVDQAYTLDKTLLLAAIQGKSAGGVTALWDAVMQGITDTAARAGRRAVIAMTDGYDNSSSSTKADAIAAANAGGVPVFTIGLGGSIDPGLADAGTQTGGFNYVAPTSADLVDIYQKISGQLSGQIQISFISPDPQTHTPPKQRTVVVKFHYGSINNQATYTYSM